MDEIICKCQVVLTGSSDRGQAYNWLRQCAPFMAVVHEFEHEGFTIFQVAGMLAFGDDEPLATLARDHLADASHIRA